MAKDWVAGQNLDSDRAIEAGVAGFVDFAHPARTNLRGYFIWAEAGARNEGQLAWIIGARRQLGRD